MPICRNSSPCVCPSGRESGNRQTDTDTQTDDVKTITPDMSQTWGVMNVEITSIEITISLINTVLLHKLRLIEMNIETHFTDFCK